MASNFCQNAISALEEYGVKHGQLPLVYIVSSVGPDHKPIFTAAARLGNRELCKETGSSKHEAHIRAADKALTILNLEDRARAEEEEENGESDDCENPVPDKDPVSALLEYTQAMRLDNPDFSLVSQEGPPHMPIFKMAVRLGNRTYKACEARSQKEVKKKAAIVTLNQLLKEGQLSKVFPTVQNRCAHSNGAKVRYSRTTSKPVERNSISELNEYAQKHGLTITYQQLGSSGPSHKPMFEVQAIFGNTVYESVKADSMKKARMMAAETVLTCLIEQRSYARPENLHSGVNDSSTNPTTLFQTIVSTSLGKIDELMLNVPLVGRKVVAAIVMTTENNKKMTVVSVASGNRCLKGDMLRHDGKAIHDSHAEVLARRGFKRYLYKVLRDQPGSLLIRGSSRKLTFRDDVAFHLYISTAPCGDGALFVNSSDKSDYYMADSPGGNHQPVFNNTKTQGLLRAKQENGEGTIPIQPGFEEQTFDGIQQGDRLRVMSCSDKICRWNVLGLQGALQSNVFEPIYLKSIVLGDLYHHGHLSRAVCCRVEHNISDRLPFGYRINHPDLGLVSMGDTSRAVGRSGPLCLNWCHGDFQPEITDGTTGMTQKTMNSYVTSSRLCKEALFHLYKAQVRQTQPGATYGIKKQDSDNYNQAKLWFEKHMKAQGYGNWIKMPNEVERFY